MPWLANGAGTPWTGRPLNWPPSASGLPVAGAVDALVASGRVRREQRDDRRADDQEWQGIGVEEGLDEQTRKRRRLEAEEQHEPDRFDGGRLEIHDSIFAVSGSILRCQSNMSMNFFLASLSSFPC